MQLYELSVCSIIRSMKHHKTTGINCKVVYYCELLGEGGFPKLIPAVGPAILTL